MRALIRVAASLGAGALLALGLWIALMPWDLSTVDQSGNVIGDDEEHWAEIWWIFLGIAAGGLLLAALPPRHLSAGLFTAAGTFTWTALFTWRAGVADVAGANLFLAAVVLFLLPASIMLTIFVTAIDRWLGDTPRPWAESLRSMGRFDR